MNDRSSWGVCAVCIPRESYYWLQDWIEHHIAAGASKVVIYDNTGSTGSTRASSVYSTGYYQQQQVSKRGEDYGRLTSHLTDKQIQEQLRDLASGYHDLVEIVTWQPQDPVTGQVVHGQVEAYADFIRRYRSDLEWAVFIDLDEYLYCMPGAKIDHMLECTDIFLPDVSLIQLRPWRFECRWSEDGPKDITTLIRHRSLAWGGEKNFVKLADVTHANIHWDWKLKRGKRRTRANAHQYAFCHYNQLPRVLVDERIIIKPRLFLTIPEDAARTFNPMPALPSLGTERVAPIKI